MRLGNLCLPVVLIDHLLKTKIEYKKYSRSIYQNDLDKACFQHNMAYGHSVDLLRTTDI